MPNNVNTINILTIKYQLFTIQARFKIEQNTKKYILFLYDSIS